MNADGTGQTRLTTNPANDGNAAWSPDGTKLAFVSNRDGDWEVYVMNADGTGQANLTNISSTLPDLPERVPSYWDLEAGRDVASIPQPSPFVAEDGAPAWSPDGTRIAFQSNRDLNYEIYVMNADGTGQTRLTDNYPTPDWSPAWLPDGSRIAFVRDEDFGPERRGNLEIYVVNADGTGQTRLTSNYANDGAPAWSPDGTKIAFESNRDGNWEIYVMNADGTGQTRLTNNSAGDWSPAWSPDGTRMAFVSSRDGNLEIYVMNADGTGQTRLTSNPALDEYPAWSRL